MAGNEITHLSVRLNAKGEPNEDDLEKVLDHVVGGGWRVMGSPIYVPLPKGTPGMIMYIIQRTNGKHWMFPLHKIPRHQARDFLYRKRPLSLTV